MLLLGGFIYDFHFCWVGYSLGFLCSRVAVYLFIACEWMNLAVFSFQACWDSPAFMMLLISLPVRPTSNCCSVVDVISAWLSQPLPLFLALFGCVFSWVLGICLRLSLILLVLHAL